MNAGKRDQGAGNSDGGEFEATLRLIANLSAPAGLADRVQAGLRVAPAAASTSGRILRWPEVLRPGAVWMQGPPARMAAAAAIVFVVIGGGWTVASHVQPAQPVRAVVLPPRMNAPAGFSSSGAMRTPQTLNRPIVAHATAAELQAVQAAIQAADKATAKKSLRRGKSARQSKGAAAHKTIAHPTAPATE